MSRELGREISRDYEGREPLLVAPLKASVVFVADLSRALGDPPRRSTSSSSRATRPAPTRAATRRIRLLKDLDAEIAGRHVLIVEDVDRHRA